MFSRYSVSRVFLVVSVVMLIGIGFIAAPPPRRVPLFIINALLPLPAVILGSKWHRVVGSIILIVALYLAAEEYSAGR